MRNLTTRIYLASLKAMDANCSNLEGIFQYIFFFFTYNCSMLVCKQQYITMDKAEAHYSCTSRE